MRSKRVDSRNANSRKGDRGMIVVTPRSGDSKPPPEPLAVDSRGAAQMLGVSERTVFKLAKEGKLICKKIGWRSLYPVASIKKYLETPDEE